MIETTHIESLIEKPSVPVKSNPKNDAFSIFLLLVLYTLQGVPLGFSYAMQILIHSIPKSSYYKQAEFSLVVWPFSLKLLWAPLVDSMFSRKLGRRKSWLIPVQYSLGILFFVMGFHIHEWLVNSNKSNINALTIMFLISNFLVATQDIIVDGWAIAMLERQNICYSAICNNAGQAFGMILGYNLLILLTSETFRNKWWRISSLPGGIVTLQGYFYFWGLMFMIVTTLIAIFKSEKKNIAEPEVDLGIFKTYKLLFSIMKLPNIKMLAIILFTVKICFCSIDATYKLKLIDGGIAKEDIATIESIFTPIRLCFPFIINKFTSQDKFLITFFNTIPYRLLIGMVLTILIYLTPYFLIQTKALLVIYKVLLLMIYSLQQLVESIMLLMAVSFYASISDPKIGGTNMTLLTTISNLGLSFSKTGALWFIEYCTFKQCSTDHTNTCSSKIQEDKCKLSSGTCQVIIDGFYTETIICIIYGMARGNERNIILNIITLFE
ncbi:acetyl-coenzyme A transporter 1-like isoform X2 [Sipha flava]|uniref:Acetyl-coenzyme A transporter 1-like isoform X2 n=1 Tax=Sipha flava TaxID=143950 RepID=A0A8B8FLA3_9HEMI|nr:acetyl-coenzyme A transporter 1-like isoform X2 [Sipha flava]